MLPQKSQTAAILQPSSPHVSHLFNINEHLLCARTDRDRINLLSQSSSPLPSSYSLRSEATLTESVFFAKECDWDGKMVGGQRTEKFSLGVKFETTVKVAFEFGLEG